MNDSRLQQIQEMQRKEPNDSFLRYALALEYAKINNIEKAIEILEKLIAQDTTYLGAYYQLGKYYEQSEQLQKAVTIYSRGITLAQLQNNKKTMAELNEALMLLEN